ncbi:amidohydrolase family protein [Campylobacter insulaenigrae]|uniref:amidohydrolase family protein n=1 Tax=Campylobacter insulaenigrae TaxID=260714 RepID=UPI002152B46B|nr:amidohydrolase family protein [Campylobacter insulaenigrae]MCR6593872.1 amidohydrolase family protein [Campylobacter insulaenigrae]
MQKIFDAHLHLWDLDQMSIPWLKFNECLNKNFNYEDVIKKYQDFDLIGAMYVEANSDDKDSEASFALKQKELYGFKLCLADINYKDEISAFREVLHTNVKGARRLLEEDFLQILKYLEKENLVFEACMKNEELAMLEFVFRTCPKLKVCLNHFGTPSKEHLDQYKKTLEKFSHYSQFFIKLSAPDNFSQETSKDFLFEIFAFLKACFGEERLLFGSNFPVAKLEPNEWAKLIIQSEVFENLDAIFYKNAFNLYERS